MDNALIGFCAGCVVYFCVSFYRVSKQLKQLGDEKGVLFNYIQETKKFYNNATESAALTDKALTHASIILSNHQVRIDNLEQKQLVVKRKPGRPRKIKENVSGGMVSMQEERKVASADFSVAQIKNP